jgi:hypothetical protein
MYEQLYKYTIKLHQHLVKVLPLDTISGAYALTAEDTPTQLHS